MGKTRTHVDENFIARHSHPFTSKSRAVIDIHAKHALKNFNREEYYKNKHEWKDEFYESSSYFIENQYTPPWYLEKHDFSLVDVAYSQHVYFTPHAVRHGFVSNYLEHDRDDSPGVQTGIGKVAKSVSIGSHSIPMFKETMKSLGIDMSSTTLLSVPCDDASELVDAAGKIGLKGKTCCMPPDFSSLCSCVPGTQGLVYKKFMGRVPRCIQDMKKLKYLELKGEITRMDSLDGLKKLKTLVLSNQRIHNIENLDELESLEILHLEGNRIEMVENLEPLQELKVLNVAGNDIKRDDSLDGIIPLEKLERVVIRENPILNRSDGLSIRESIKKEMKNRHFSFI